VLAPDRSIELEGRAVIEYEARVVSGCCRSQRALLSNRNRIDGPRMTVDFTDSISTIPGEEVTVSLSSVSYGDDALRITVPCDVIDSTVDNRIVAFCKAFSYTVPDLYGTCNISTSNIEARWRETCDGGLRGVFCVLPGICGVVN
jgi:hypothetical protein